MIQLTVYENSTVQGVIEVTDSDTFPLALTKSNADLRDITKRRGTFSKQFKILATTNNNKVLKYIYNANVTPDVYRDCILSYNNAEVLRGKIQCLSVAQTKQGDEYSLVVYSDSVDWYFLLNAALIGDYDYGNEEIPSFGMSNGQLSGVIPAGNTSTLNRAYIEASWRNKDKFDYVYNLVSYGQPINGTFVAEKDLRPSIYLGKMLKKAFASVGYTLKSDFFTTGIGASLILQFTGDGFTSSGFNSFNARALGDIILNSAAVPYGFNYFRMIPNQVIEDIGGIYNPTTGVITITTPGEYTFDFQHEITIQTPFLFTATVDVVIRDTVTLQEYGSVEAVDNTPAFAGFDWPVEISGSTTPAQYPAGTYEIVLKIGVFDYNTAPNTITLLSGASFIQNFQLNITQGQTYNINSTLPQYKVLDIIGGLQNMFNLYFDTDNENNTVTIEPKPVLVKPISQGVDFSPTLDVQNQLTTDFISTYNRFLRFRFKSDSKDGFQEAYNLQQGSIFGSVQYDLGEDFKEGFTDTGTNYFAATLQYNVHPFCPSGEFCPIPVLWAENALSPPKSYAFEPRILYYKGYEDIFLPNGRKAAWNWIDTSLTTVPSSFMVDPNFNEANPVNILYGDRDNANGLANTYYTADIAVIMDRRVHKAWFRLTATGFYNLDLYKPIFIDHPNYRGWYYINQVIDFTPNREKTTLFELVRAYDSLPNNRPVATEIPTIQGGNRQRTAMGGGTLTANQPASNESAVLHNGSGNVGIIRGAGVVMGNAGIQSVTGQHVFGNYNFPNTSIWVVGVGNNNGRYNGLQFAADGRVLEHGGAIYVNVDGSMRDVVVNMEVNGTRELSKTYLTGQR